MTEISNTRINPLFWFGFIYLLASQNFDSPSEKYEIYISGIMFAILLVMAIVFRQKETISIDNKSLNLQLVDLEAKLELSENSYCEFPKSYTEMVITTPKAKLTIKTHRFKKKKLLNFLATNKLYNNI